jgi:hypothetical protein
VARSGAVRRRAAGAAATRSDATSAARAPSARSKPVAVRVLCRATIHRPSPCSRHDTPRSTGTPSRRRAAPLPLPLPLELPLALPRPCGGRPCPEPAVQDLHYLDLEVQVTWAAISNSLSVPSPVSASARNTN